MKLNLNKDQILKGIILLLAIGVFVSLAWAGVKIAEKKGEDIKEEEQSTTEKNQVVNSQEAQLENYVPKEILFVPWGSGEGEVGLREVEMSVQGIATTTIRYGPSKIEVDKDGNIYIWNAVWGKLEPHYKEIKRIDNPYIHKYVKEKITKGTEIIERYKYDSSIPLEYRIEKIVKENKTIYNYIPINKATKKPIVIDTFKSGYRYEFYPIEAGERLGLRIINNKTGEIEKNIEIQRLSDFGPPDIVIGDDKEGNIYLLEELIAGATGGLWYLEIYKYKQDGTLLERIKLSTDISTYRFANQKDRITVDKEGNIYQLLPKEEGVHILKWEIK